MDTFLNHSVSMIFRKCLLSTTHQTNWPTIASSDYPEWVQQPKTSSVWSDDPLKGFIYSEFKLIQIQLNFLWSLLPFSTQLVAALSALYVHCLSLYVFLSL